MDADGRIYVLEVIESDLGAGSGYRRSLGGAVSFGDFITRLLGG
jgi:hypothetical protein